ncbi:autotransporter outer membrane beta-barrel domain-containing protein, partial [Escherichia coli]|nr:autotransporter outer membrane beta-barrel domain-containing protein [Escherichia coli]
MNKIFNVIWSESAGKWVVTSELTREGGQRPRQIRRTALAGVIAGILMQATPVMATDYNGETLEDITMDLYDGDTATSTTINSGGRQFISSGGSATSTTINSGGGQFISSGGSATSTINNGYQLVRSGGSATSTTISSSGIQDVSSGGSATSTTISGGRQMLFGGSATSTTINGGR